MHTLSGKMVKVVYTIALLLWASLCAQAQEEPIFDETQQQDEGQTEEAPRAKMAPEAQRITLESVSADCFDSVYSVLNAEADQNTLSDECKKEMNEGYSKSPLGQIQSKELMVSQTAALLRLSSSCRQEFLRASQPQEGAEAVQPSESCVDAFQKHYRDMQQWITASTLSKLSQECRKEMQSGNLGAECEAEFVAVKPQILQTLENQNEQKAKEPPKAEKKKSNASSEAKPKKVKPAPPLIDPGFLFFAFWSLVIAGTIAYTCVYYYQNPNSVPVISETSEVPEQKSKTQMKKEARQQKRATRRT